MRMRLEIDMSYTSATSATSLHDYDFKEMAETISIFTVFKSFFTKKLAHDDFHDHKPIYFHST